MEKIYERSSGLIPGGVTGFCPGCMHSTTHKLLGEVFAELGIEGDAVCVYGIGCCSLGRHMLKANVMGAPHGRACAVATGMKRSRPGKVIFTYQGDGDLASIGLAETMSAANRGENFTVIFVNNSTYGMTGGQMAPTTLVGMKATTAPSGRDPKQHGYPIHMCEQLAGLKAPAYLARVTCTTPANIKKAREAIKKAFQYQLDGKGFSMVEIMSNCPTNWGISPLETLEFMKENTLKEYELGEFRAV
ncbi:MAG TPA: thiamine pyrophosphate-dependent enzyme [Candidatus Acidoferrum sp.]|nr:thiamine pyrophosphate-dependent enzyme [Candidatus Acidoferrum sp.]